LDRIYRIISFILIYACGVQEMLSLLYVVNDLDSCDKWGRERWHALQQIPCEQKVSQTRVIEDKVNPKMLKFVIRQTF
jgi:hypothetical protein